jgi:hypothetical protein
MGRARLIIMAIVVILMAIGVALPTSQYKINRSVVSGDGGERSSAGHSWTDVIGEPVGGVSLGQKSTFGSGFLAFVPAQAQSLEIPLKAGWNMVSVPVMPADNSVGAVFPGVAAVYIWDPINKTYFVPSKVSPEKGYWVAVTVDKAITVTGTAFTAWTTAIEAGWNMIGSVVSSASIANPNDTPDGSVQPFAYWWDPSSKAYGMTTTIEPGRGYWIASTRACQLTLVADANVSILGFAFVPQTLPVAVGTGVT